MGDKSQVLPRDGTIKAAEWKFTPLSENHASACIPEERFQFKSAGTLTIQQSSSSACWKKEQDLSFAAVLEIHRKP